MRFIATAVLLAAALTPTASMSAVVTHDQLPAWSDMSPAGMHAAVGTGAVPQRFFEDQGLLPAGAAEAARAFVVQSRELGVERRSGFLPLAAPLNVRANNPAGDRVGETQSEVSVAAFRDTVVIGWNDSQGFLGTPITLTSYAYSVDGGNTFIDGGSVPLAVAGDQSFGDTGWDTDENGNWYLVQLYTRAGGQQNVAVHHARFNGVGTLVLDPPTQASIGTAATGLLDKCLIGVDRVTGNVYVAYTRFLGNGNIEIVRSTTLGLTWDPAIILDNTAVPTASKQAARPICGPGGEVYVVWEKGANTINCPDGAGNVVSSTGVIAFTRSLNNGVTYDPFTNIGTVEHSWTFSGPGDLRERANEFPDIAVDLSNGCYRGNVYVTWHESAPWSTNIAAGPVTAESNDAANNNPTGPQLFNVGDNCTGSSSSTGDLDYWQFNGVQGTTYFMNLDPQGFNCGIAGTTRGMRMRLFAVTSPFPNPNGFPDSLLAASALGAFAQRIVWTCPKTGSYLIRLQPSTTAIGTYTLRVRTLAFGAPSPARDSRDITLIRSTNQGVSWSPEQRINDDPAGLENRRPFIAVNNSGQVTAYWHDSRDAGFGSTASITGIYGTVSRDGGVTWSPNFGVTDEPSFFSFNTIAVPNLGDYNQASARGTAIFHPAWSDQRISTGDVRTPNTNTFTAGRGPDAYTTGISFIDAIACPPDTFASSGSTIVRHFKITNTGTAPDNYNYSVTDVAGWISPTGGTTGILQPSSFFDVFVTVNLPSDCTPPSDILTLSVLPVGEGCYAPQTCQTKVQCEIVVPALISMFEVKLANGGVDLDWSSIATGLVSGWNLYRSTDPAGFYSRINDSPIVMGDGGSFHYHDAAPGNGSFYYQLRGVMNDGSERVLETRGLTVTGAPTAFAFTNLGSNPSLLGTTLSFALPKAENVHIAVYNIAGAQVRTLFSGLKDPGVHTVSFNMKDSNGRALSPGVYLVKIRAGEFQKSLHVIALQ